MLNMRCWLYCRWKRWILYRFTVLLIETMYIWDYTEIAKSSWRLEGVCQIKMMIMMNCFVVCLTIGIQPHFQLGVFSESCTILNLQHAVSRGWTCAEHKLRFRWMNLCSSGTTTPHTTKWWIHQTREIFSIRWSTVKYAPYMCYKLNIVPVLLSWSPSLTLKYAK